MKLSVGKWNKDYQFTGVPRMSDLFGRMRAEDDDFDYDWWVDDFDPAHFGREYEDIMANDEDEDNNFRVESHTDRIARLQKQIEDAKKEMEKVKYCNHQEWESINKNIGLIDENSFSLTIKCSNCGSHGVAEWEEPTFISWDRTYMTEELEAETKMHPDWCSNCGMKDDGCINLGYGDWYCMNFLNNRETYDGRYDKFRGEEEDMNLLNTYFEEEVYRLSPDIYAEVKDRIDYNSKQLGNNPSHQDRLKQFQSRVRRIDENIYQRAMETAQMRIAKEEEDFEAEGEVECNDCGKSFDLSETKTWIDDERYCADCLDFQRKQALKDDEALQREEENERIVRAIRRDRGDEYYAEDFEYEDAIGYCGVCNSPYDFNGVEETCGVMCRNCPKELTDGPNWKLSVVKNPLHANYEFDNMRGESGMCYYGINCQKCDNEPVAIIAWEESWDEPDYFCSSCWNNMEGDETEFYERIAIQPSKRNNIKNKNLIAKKLLNAEGEDMTLKDSAKLGFGLGAGLLGFRVALFGVSALVGGFILNRNK